MITPENYEQMFQFFNQMNGTIPEKELPRIKPKLSNDQSILEAIYNVLRNIDLGLRTLSKDVLDHEEAAYYTSLSKRDLHGKKDAIPHEKPGGKNKYYRKNDLRRYKLNSLEKQKGTLAP